MRTQPILIFAIVVFCLLNESIFCAAPPGGIEAKCSSEFGKVGVCLGFATGKTNTPSKECCSTVEEIKEKSAVCLCFIIQQVHDGSATVKQLGLQEEKLIQLPAACNLANASVTECPTLLGLAPNSPDAGIFTKPSSSASPATPTSDTSSSPKKDSSVGFMQRPFLTSPITIVVAISITVFITAFSV